MIELVENANRILNDLRSHFAKVAILTKRLHVFSNSAVKRLGAIPRHAAPIKKMTEFLYAICGRSTGRGGRRVSSYIALERRDEFVKRLVTRKSIDRIDTGHLAAAFKPIQQGKETR